MREALLRFGDTSKWFGKHCAVTRGLPRRVLYTSTRFLEDSGSFGGGKEISQQFCRTHSLGTRKGRFVPN